MDMNVVAKPSIGTMIFEIINLLIVIALICLIFYTLIKIPRYLKEKRETMKRIENTLDEINQKLSNR
ncbi:hypothetical protein [Anaerosalibacter sp. Marseille-P3206]|uniref:hypothetical protein n=1 Tax=Anaerosalibacter sp. Marseille-P3206 TaxID=1871005 RepID=UPI0009844A6F|nr:hypothetical protein [Anaerosalibacter sp. Marseille-P3206]